MKKLEMDSDFRLQMEATKEVGHEVECSTVWEKKNVLMLGCAYGYLVIHRIDSNAQLLQEKIHDWTISDLKVTDDFLTKK